MFTIITKSEKDTAVKKNKDNYERQARIKNNSRINGSKNICNKNIRDAGNSGETGRSSCIASKGSGITDKLPGICMGLLYTVLLVWLIAASTY